MKRIIALTLSIVMMLSFIYSVNADELDSLSVTSQFNGGSGTQSDPYRVSTYEQLNTIREYSDKYFVQTGDITVPNDAKWEPITSFSGDYNGNGYKIVGLKISIITSLDYRDLTAAFIIDNTGNIHDLELSNCNISASARNNKIAYTTYVGGLVCVNNGTVERCGISGSVSASHDSGSAYCGGIAMKNEGSIKFCYNYANITASNGGNYAYAGGIVASNSEIIINSYNIGSVNTYGLHGMAGGIVGTGGSNLTNCYNCGDVAANNEYSYELSAGGIVGRGGTEEISYWNIDSRQKVKNVVLENSDKKGVGVYGPWAVTDATISKTSTEMKSSDFVELLNQSLTEQEWILDENNINNGYPILRFQSKYEDNTTIDVVQEGCVFGEELPDYQLSNKPINATYDIVSYTGITKQGTEYSSDEKPTEAGTYRITVKCRNPYAIFTATSEDFTIEQKNIALSDVILGDALTYNRNPQTQDISSIMIDGVNILPYCVISNATETNPGNYNLTITAKADSNYTGTISKAFTIAKKNITPTIEDVSEINYTGVANEPILVVKDGDFVLSTPSDYSVSYSDNTNVGTAKATVIPNANGNYIFTETVKNFNIVAIEQSPIITETASLTRDGHTLDLNTLVTNTKGDVSFAISGEANGCTIGNGVLTSGVNEGTIKITVSITAKDVNGDSINEYNAYAETDAITVTINDKATQAALNITSETTVTCGQTLNLTSEGGSGDGVTTYTVTNGTGEATIDGNTLTAVKGGTVTVVATKSEDTTYNSISSSPVTISIEKIKISAPLADETVYTYNGIEQTYNLPENSAYTISGNKQTNANETGYTVSVSINNTDTHTWEDGTTDAKNYIFVIKKANISITAKDKSIYKGSTVPTLTATDYTVSGLVNGESLKTAPTIEYGSTPNTKTEGTVEIKVYGAEAPDGGNYNDISYTNGTLTITKKPSSGGGGGGGGAPTSYTIKFESNGGSEVKTITVNKNAVATEPTAPVKDDFKFDGWYTDKELTTVYDFATKVTKNFTLYAKWAEIEKELELYETKITFTDVKKTDWFYEYIKYVIDNELMNGVSNDNFAPNDTLTRAMLVTVLYRHAGEPATNRSIPFADVDMGAYYANAVSWAKQNSIISGINENVFAPNDNITREQIAAIMHRYAQYKGYDVSVGENTNIHSYDDFDSISEYAIASLQWACGSGLMKGKSTSTLNPLDNATRAEIAAILHRFIEVNK